MTGYDIYLLPACNFAPEDEDIMTPSEEAIAADWAELIATCPPDGELDFDAFEHRETLAELLQAA